MAKIRVGVMGCGGIAQMMHIPYLIEIPDFELVALSDTNEAVMNDVGAKFHVERRYTDWRELLAQTDLDAVAILHSGSHRETVIAALDAGKHVFVEKPLAWTLRETLDVQQRAAASDRVVQLGYHKLYDPGFAFAKEHLAEIDDLAFVDCTVLHAADSFNRAPYPILRGSGDIGQFDYNLPDWETMLRDTQENMLTGEFGSLIGEALGERRGDPRLHFGFGMLAASVIHQIYTLFGFLGDPLEVLHADFWRGGHSMHILFAFPNEVRCAINWHNLPYLNDYRETYSFYGNHKRMKFELPGPYYRNVPSPVTLQGGDGELSWEKRVIVSYREAFHNELLAFADSIVNGTPTRASIADAVKHSRFIEDIVRAVR